MDYSTLDVVRGDAFGNIRRAEAFNRGKQVLGENIADLAGLLTAHDAYLLSLKDKADVVIGGLTGEQRFFFAFAQRWRKTQDETALRRQIRPTAMLRGNTGAIQCAMSRLGTEPTGSYPAISYI